SPAAPQSEVASAPPTLSEVSALLLDPVMRAEFQRSPERIEQAASAIGERIAAAVFTSTSIRISADEPKVRAHCAARLPELLKTCNARGGDPIASIVHTLTDSYVEVATTKEKGITARIA